MGCIVNQSVEKYDGQTGQVRPILLAAMLAGWLAGWMDVGSPLLHGL